MPANSDSRARDETVLERVLEFDGKTTGCMETACRSAGKGFSEFDRLLELAVSEDTRLQIAATSRMLRSIE